MSEFLIQHGADVNTEDSSRSTLLHKVSAYGKLHIRKYFQTSTTFRFVLVSGDSNIVKFLIEHGANINAKNENKYTPLHKAVSRSN